MAQPGKPNPPKATTAGKPVTSADAKAQPAAAPAAKAQPATKAQPAAAAQPAATAQPAAAPKPAAKPAAAGIGGAERARMISEAAYFIAQQRGSAGNPLADWLAAEKQIESQLGQRR
jgi:Protein of unknown function (DUF2934)